MGESKSWIVAGLGLAGRRSAAPLLPYAAAQGGLAPIDAADPDAGPRWPWSRVAAVEALWGKGFTTPGGAPEMLRLVKPLGLSPSATLLLLGGGLGGPADSISATFGAWIASHEAEDGLRAPALARQVAAPRPKQDRIAIAGWDRARPDFRPRSANHVVALEALRGTRPAPLLDSLAAAIVPGGQIVLTELVSDDHPTDRDREFAAWCRLEDRLPELPRAHDVTETLQRLHFDVRVVEDLSDRHIAQILAGWRQAVRAMAAGPRPATQIAWAFVSEAELWLLRIRLMRRLGVRLVRWHAIGAPG